MIDVSILDKIKLSVAREKDDEEDLCYLCKEVTGSFVHEDVSFLVNTWCCRCNENVCTNHRITTVCNNCGDCDVWCQPCAKLNVRNFIKYKEDNTNKIKYKWKHVCRVCGKDVCCEACWHGSYTTENELNLVTCKKMC